MIATETIWSQFSHSLHRYISHRVNNTADRQDLLQEIFVKIHTKKHLLKESKKLQSWLYAITNNAIIDYYKKNKRLASLASNIEEEKSTHSMDNEETAYDSLSRCLPPFIQELKPYEQNLLTWIDLEGQKQKDVAERLGIPYSTLKSQLQRARKKLLRVFLNCCNYHYDSRGRVIGYQKREDKNN